MGSDELDAEHMELDERAFAFLKAGQEDEYLAMMEALVGEAGQDPWVRLHYATALSLIRPEDAPPEMRAAVALAPDDPLILTHAAGRMFELGEFEDSQEYVSRAGSLVDLSDFVLGSDLVHLAGRLADHQGDAERARALLKGAVDVGPEDLEHARYVKDYARFLARQGEIEAARELARAALVHHPDDDELRALSETDSRQSK